MVTHSSLTHTPASFPVIKLVGNSILPYMEQFLLIFVNLNHEHNVHQCAVGCLYFIKVWDPKRILMILNGCPVRKGIHKNMIKDNILD